MYGPRAAAGAGAGAAAGRGTLCAVLCPGSALSVQRPLQAALQRGHGGLRIPLVQVAPGLELPQLQAQLCTDMVLPASEHVSPCCRLQTQCAVRRTQVAGLKARLKPVICVC